jgi:hypothetical protein
MARRICSARIEAALSALALDLPLSPELVLVSPPEEALLARQLLPEPVVAQPRVVPATRSLGMYAFSAFCVANSLAPFVLALAFAR